MKIPLFYNLSLKMEGHRIDLVEIVIQSLHD